MKVVVINLERAMVRRGLMERGLAHLGIDYEIMRAIDASQGEHLPVSRYDEQASVLDYRRALCAAEIACFASHYLLWQRSIVEKQPLVVMEDDVSIEDGFVHTLRAAEALINRVPLIRLVLNRPNEEIEHIEDLDHGLSLVRHAKDSGITGMQCYAFSPAGASALVRHASVWSMTIDGYMSSFKMHGLENYGILPQLAFHADQEVYPSTIEDRPTSWTRPPRTLGLLFKREIHQFRRDRKLMLYKAQYTASLLRCSLRNLVMPWMKPRFP
jgi:glycosyl transferase, family 25